MSVSTVVPLDVDAQTLQSVAWCRRVNSPTTNAARVLVYTIDLRIDGEEAAMRALGLSDAERERSRRFVHERDRRRYVAAHSALRRILGDALEQPPEAVQILATPHHKPRLLDGNGLHFNLTHSGDLALVATTTIGPVGVDVERVRALEDMARVADKVFCDDELAQWGALPSAQRGEAFFYGWTRKEALIKATGEGFRADLKALCVSLGPDAAPVVRTAPEATGTPWQLVHLEPWPGYVGAVAMRSAAPLDVICRTRSIPS